MCALQVKRASKRGLHSRGFRLLPLSLTVRRVSTASSVTCSAPPFSHDVQVLDSYAGCHLADDISCALT
jgi:hypothetical protein